MACVQVRFSLQIYGKSMHAKCVPVPNRLWCCCLHQDDLSRDAAVLMCIESSRSLIISKGANFPFFYKDLVPMGCSFLIASCIFAMFAQLLCNALEPAVHCSNACLPVILYLLLEQGQLSPLPSLDMWSKKVDVALTMAQKVLLNMVNVHTAWPMVSLLLGQQEKECTRLWFSVEKCATVTSELMR